MIYYSPFLYKSKLTIHLGYIAYPLEIPIDYEQEYDDLPKDIKKADELTIDLKFGDKVISSTFKTKDIKAMFLETRAIE